MSYFRYFWSFSWHFRGVSWSQYRSFVVVSDRTPVILCKLRITLSVFCGNFWLQYLYFVGISGCNTCILWEFLVAILVFCGSFWLQYLCFVGISGCNTCILWEFLVAILVFCGSFCSYYCCFVKDLWLLFGESSCCYFSFQTCYWCYFFIRSFCDVAFNLYSTFLLYCKIFILHVLYMDNCL